ncbi:MAG: peptidoglycan DD-metalloendopeptidase family protein [Sphingobacteriaceae bacterium]
MKTKNKEYSTILIVGKNQQHMKSIPVKTKHLERWKHYLLTLSGVFVVLIISILYLTISGNKQEEQNRVLNIQLSALKKQIPLATDTNVAKSYIQQIENKLVRVTNYLSRRGIPGFKHSNIGGNTSNNTGLSAVETYKLYDEYLGRIVNEIAFTPLGYPHYSGKSSIYGYRNDPFHSGRADFHSGIDIRGRTGDAVKSTANGRVFLAGWYQGYGNCVRIKHANNFETLYGHLSKINVKVGELVEAGQIVGKVGSTGHSTGPHLHYEVRLNGKPLNPNKFLNLN